MRLQLIYAGLVASEQGGRGGQSACASLAGEHRRWGVASEMASLGSASSVGCLHAQWLCWYALPCPALPCPALPCPALPCPALPCTAQLQSAMPGPALPCHASRPMCAVLCLHDACVTPACNVVQQLCKTSCRCNMKKQQHTALMSHKAIWLILSLACCLAC